LCLKPAHASFVLVQPGLRNHTLVAQFQVRESNNLTTTGSRLRVSGNSML
jgi:hypothetical protein